MSYESRPGSRGSRSARRANRHELEADRLKAHGVLSNEDEIAARARAEAVTCPLCGEIVHPVNWHRHMLNTHADEKQVALHEVHKRLPLSVIRTDGGTQPRAEINDETVAEYAEALQGGAELPAVEVYYDGQHYWLADGFHRVAAARQIDWTDYPAIVSQGTQRDAILHSVGVNATHGLRRTNADKRRAAERLLRDEEWAKWSDREIARRCVVDNSFVSRVRKELSLLTNHSEDGERTYTTKHGTPATMQTGRIGKRPEKITYGPSEDDYQPDVPSIEIDDDNDWEISQQHPPKNGRYSGNAEERRLGGRGAPVQMRSGQIGALAFVTSNNVAYVDTRNGRRQYRTDYVQPAGESAAQLDAVAEVSDAPSKTDTSVPVSSWQLIQGDLAFAADQIDDESVDVVLSNAPLYTMPNVAALALRALKPGGSLLLWLANAKNIPTVMEQIPPEFTYHWMLAHVTNSQWMPYVWYTKGGVGYSLGHLPNDAVTSDAEIIQRISQPGQVILEPFCTGDVAEAAVRLKRQYIGIHDDAYEVVALNERLLACIATA